MITKAIVEEVINKYQVRVRIPILHKTGDSPMATPFNELPIATICCQPGLEPVFVGGDIVFVLIEDNDVGKPVVVGQLFRQNNTSTSNTDLLVNTLSAKHNAVLPLDTSIGNVSSNSIQSLEGANGNLERRLQLLEDKLLFTHRYGIVLEEDGKSKPTDDDVTAVMDYVIGNRQFSKWQIKAADVNFDGVVDQVDASLISRYIQGSPVPTTKIPEKFVYREE